MREGTFDPVILYASPSGYLVFGTIWGVCLAFAIYDGFLTNIIVSLALLIFSGVWLSRYRITLSRDEISYRTLFGGSVSLRTADIKCAAVQDRFGGNRKPGGAGAVIIQPWEETDLPRLVINMKPFSKAAIGRVLDYLRPKLPEFPSDKSYI